MTGSVVPLVRNLIVSVKRKLDWKYHCAKERTVYTRDVLWEYVRPEARTHLNRKEEREVQVYALPSNGITLPHSPGVPITGSSELWCKDV